MENFEKFRTLEFLENFPELNREEEKCDEDTVLSTWDYTIIKIVQVTHRQGNIRYVVSKGIQCSCMSLISKLDIV